MKHESTVFKTLDLAGGSVVPFPSLPGERVRVLDGRIWLTEEGSLRDAVLAPGEEVALGTRGLAVIEALGPARIQLFESIGLAGLVLNATRRLTRSLTAWWARQFAARSHQRAFAAVSSGVMAEEIVEVRIPQRRGEDLVVSRDEGIRPGVTAESLSSLRPETSGF